MKKLQVPGSFADGMAPFSRRGLGKKKVRRTNLDCNTAGSIS